MSLNTIGDRIRYARKQAGLTQFDLAEKCGITRAAVSQWEVNETIPSTRFLLVIEAVTGCSTGWILSGRGAVNDELLAMARQAVNEVIQTANVRLTDAAYQRLVDHVLQERIDGVELTQVQLMRLVALLAS
jgi:transcriptional regulator with XRE-family HTH domain